MPFKRRAAIHFALQYALIFKKEKYAMKASQFFISTLKEAPAEAALASHKLMIRAGLIKANASRSLYLDADGPACIAQS